MQAFRMIGNLYFVGTEKASSHLFVTEEGLILLDTGYDYTAEIIINGIKELGFDVKDVKYIIHSHGHYDHTGGTKNILQVAPNAKTFLSLNDVRYIPDNAFYPDYPLTDGLVIKLGSTEILCKFTPGHTEGSFSFFFNVEEDGKTYRAGMFGGAGTNQLKREYMERRNVPMNMRDEFFNSIDMLLKEKVDVMIGNHAKHNKTFEKHLLMGKTEQNPYINDKEWEQFLLSLKVKLTEIIQSGI